MERPGGRDVPGPESVFRVSSKQNDGRAGSKIRLSGVRSCARGRGVALQQADHVGVRRDEVLVGADVARTYMAFTTQRLSVAVQYSAAQKVTEALGLSVAADPRAAALYFRWRRGA